MNHFFTTAKKKIAVMFALTSSSLIIGATILTMILMRYQMDQRANTLLTDTMNELLNGYEVAQLDEKAVRFQYDTSQSTSEDNGVEDSVATDTTMVESESTNENTVVGSGHDTNFETSREKLPNVITEENLDQDNISDADVELLQESKNVYTRVIDKEGYVLYTSDLFDNFTIDFRTEGFVKTETMNTCIYSLTSKIDTGEHVDTTLQAAIFCQITPRQQLSLGYIMVAIATITSISAYIIGSIIAQRMLRPLKNSVEQTRNFTQNTYHELLTPISVALSTTESSIKTKSYKKGLISVLEDLTAARKSLQFLGIHALHQKGDFKNEKVNIEQLIRSEAKKLESSLQRSDIELNIESKNISIIKTNRKAVEIIFRNLISNAFKFTKKSGAIKIKIEPRRCIIENSIDKNSKIDPSRFFKKYYREDANVDGSGLGLTITQSLVEDLGWSINVKRICNEPKQDKIVVRVGF